MLRRAFFKGVAAAVGGLFAGGWPWGRGKVRCRCGLPADEHPGFWKSQVKPHKESTLEDYRRVNRHLDDLLRCSPDCPECRGQRKKKQGDSFYTDCGPARPGGIRERMGAAMEAEIGYGP